MAEEPSASPAAASTSTMQAFASLGNIVDGRILRSLASQGFTQPTPIQSTVLPLAITENKDILARAKTGSGKTLAYAIPLVQKILSARAKLEDGYSNPNYLATRALVLVPTRELAEQITSHITTLCEFFKDRDAIRIVNVAGSSQSSKGKTSQDKVQKLQLADKPDVVVATPSRALIHLRSGALNLEHLESLTIDEADLILSYGHSSDDIKSILSGGPSWTLPAVYQSFLMSATLTEEVDELKSVVLRNPVTVKLSDSESTRDGSTNKLTQYVVRTTEDDKFLLIYVILKLKLVKGKILIFVNDTNRGYRLKLFLEKFGIRAGVLNAELPFNSRYHAVQEFNRGVFNYLIATDESGLEGIEKDSDDEESDTEEPALISTQVPEAAGETAEGEEGTSSSKKRKADESSQPSKKKRKQQARSSQQTEYGVTRGIDFVDVACVINFDLPASARSYTHRIGRTARAGRSGMSLSFVVPKKQWGNTMQKGLETSLKSAKRDQKIWKRIEKDQKLNFGVPDDQIKEYIFDMKQVEGFRYRMEDGLKSVTRAYVREARIKEIKNEVLNSDKLKAHFEDNPRDLAFLKHDKPLNPNRVQPHMKHVPSYLMPRIAPVGGAALADGTPAGEGLVNGEGSSGGSTNLSGKYIPYRKTTSNNKRGGRGGKSSKSGKRGDPLKSFKRK